MAASSTFMIAEAERRFPVRIRIGVPPDGLGYRLDGIKAWLDENSGANGWAITPSGTRGVLNDRAGRWNIARWCAQGALPTRLPLTGARVVPPVPAPLADAAHRRRRGGPAGILRRDRRPAWPGGPCRAPRAIRRNGRERFRMMTLAPSECSWVSVSVL
jgi:hypothetical protein